MRMRKFFYLALTVVSLNLTGCGYDDDDVWNAINGQEERIAALESWQKTANENIAALQAIVNGNDYITSVKAVTENGEVIGYTISFLKQGDVTIYNGTKGDKGDKGDQGDKGDKGDQGDKGDKGEPGVPGQNGSTPLIGLAKQSDGKWYWTLNGELMKDADGNPICANGKDGADGADGSDGSDGSDGTKAPLPKLKTGSELGGAYEADAVYLSVDGGTTWTKVSGNDGLNGDSFFSDAPVDNGGSWTFTLVGGTQIVVPKYALLILNDDNGNPIKNGQLKVTLPSESFSIHYSVGEPAKYMLSIKVKEEGNGDKLSYTESDGKITFQRPEGAHAITVLFTLTAEDNQTFFYQVKVKIVGSGSGDVISNEGLVEAIKDLPGVVLDDDGNVDVEASKQLIESMTSLSLSGKDLSNLEGLEYFSSLTSLDCSNNNLEDLDVSSLPNLTSLNCSNNNLEDLDVSHLTNLTELYCSDNSLPSLDISGLTNLEVLDCSRCFGQSAARSISDGILDLSAHPQLKRLYCSENKLKGLIVTNNPELQEINCWGNELTSLDLSQNVKLEFLECGNNQLGKLDVTKNVQLVYFYCINNKLTELDVTKNVQLIEFNCGGNSLREIDVTKNTLLELFCVYNNLLTSLDITKNVQLKAFNCQSNRLRFLDISKNTVLNEVYCDAQRDENMGDRQLILTVNEAQKTKWEENWKDWNSNVVISESVVDLFGGSGTNFGNGGQY